MALEPITRMEKILSGEKIDPVTRREYFVQEAIQNGGSGETYETVAEIQVGEMTEEEGLYVSRPDTPFTDDLQTGDTLFLEIGSEKYPLEIIRDEEEGFLRALWYNWSADDGATGTPAFYLEYESDSGVIESLVSTEDLSDKTVRILKKASAPSGSDRLVVTLTKTGTGSEAVYSADKTFSEIKAALDAKKDVEVLYPYDLTGVSNDPIFIHLYPLAYWEGNRIISFSSIPTTLGDGLFTVTASCTYDSDETRWITGRNEIAESKEFAFTATPDGQSGFTVTPAAGVTYAAILDAVGSTPLVFARISVPSLNKTIIARFSGIDSGSTGILTATVVEYFNSAYCVMALDVYSDGRMIVTVQPIPSQS